MVTRHSIKHPDAHHVLFVTCLHPEMAQTRSTDHRSRKAAAKKAQTQGGFSENASLTTGKYYEQWKVSIPL